MCTIVLFFFLLRTTFSYDLSQGRLRTFCSLFWIRSPSRLWTTSYRLHGEYICIMFVHAYIYICAYTRRTQRTMCVCHRSRSPWPACCVTKRRVKVRSANEISPRLVRSCARAPKSQCVRTYIPPVASEIQGRMSNERSPVAARVQASRVRLSPFVFPLLRSILRIVSLFLSFFPTLPFFSSEQRRLEFCLHECVSWSTYGSRTCL